MKRNQKLHKTVARGLRPYTGFLKLCKRVCAQSGNNSLSAMRTTTLQQQQNHNLINKKQNLIKLKVKSEVLSKIS